MDDVASNETLLRELQSECGGPAYSEHTTKRTLYRVKADAKVDAKKQGAMRELYSSIQRIRKDGATEAREQAVMKAGEEVVMCLKGSEAHNKWFI